MATVACLAAAAGAQSLAAGAPGLPKANGSRAAFRRVRPRVAAGRRGWRGAGRPLMLRPVRYTC